jgi:hypothetical protein
VEKAPTQVDDLARYFWLNYEATPDTIAQAVDTLHTAAGGEKLLGGQHKSGKIGSLQAGDFDGVALEVTPAPAKARGFYILHNMPCPLADAERITDSRAQATIHPGIYDSYHRDFTLDFDAYDARQSDALAWETTYKATILGAQYSAESRETMRYIAASHKTGGRTFVLAKTWQVRPATFSGDNALDQDYEIEAFYPASDGTTMHFYAIWRDIHIGAFSIQDEITLSIVVDQLVLWDDRSAEVCKNGLVDAR